MTLGITITGAVYNTSDAFAGNRVHPVIPAIFNGIADELKATFSHSLLGITALG
jgi:hypothetical protein